MKEKELQVLSLINPKDIKHIDKIPTHGICGTIDVQTMSPESFVENTEFANFMHDVISRKGMYTPSLKNAAKNREDSYLYIIDLRTPEGVMGNVPNEDIIGAFKVKNRKIVKNSYERFEPHKIYTKNGLVKLPPELEKLVVDEIISSDNNSTSKNSLIATAFAKLKNMFKDS